MTQFHPTIRTGCGFLLAAVLAAAVPAPARSAADDGHVATELVDAVAFRSVGPYRGGRVTAVTGVPAAPYTFYMGSTGGGVWKTTDAGETWINVSDGWLGAGSIGAVAVAPSDPNVVYAGTGSACIRGNVSPGDGVYRSTDAGQSWHHIGLEESGQVGAIVVHPRDADVVYVAALGHAFGPNAQRGVFRSRDGGESWERILFVSEQAGAVDVALDPTNPRVLFAATWEVVRRPWTLISGGPGGGLYRSTDGGDSWRELTRGLPEGLKGRIGVAVSPARPARVWAIVEAEDGGLFRSDDGGDSFRLVSDDRNLRQRAWYYSHVIADPVDPNTVYVLNVGLHRSIDGGRSFAIIRAPHPDHHALWIHPSRPELMINGNDGGANVSLNGGATWSTQANQPTGEFYRVTVDQQFPYRLYGAQQDNSTVSLPSRTTHGGIEARDWYPVGGGESGHIAVDPEQPDVVYAGSYGGTLTRYDHRTGALQPIMAYPVMAVGQAASDLEYRFQWNAPLRISPHDPDALYHCSNVVHRSLDEGRTWSVISPDLTRDDEAKQDYSGGPITWDNTGVEVYGTIFAFEISPHEAGVFWAGSDDGLVHVSRDGGESWNDVTPPDMPEWGQVNGIELSPHRPGSALLAVTRYRLDDFRPYIFRTDDYGRSWRQLADGDDGLPADHFVRAIQEDPIREDLLYAGTEFGLYVSFDGGDRWLPLGRPEPPDPEQEKPSGGALPITPVTDLAVTDGDLVVATQGRAFWIADDLTLLRQLEPDLERRRAWLAEPAPALRMGGSRRARGPVGQNPPAGATLQYWLGVELAEGEELVLEVLAADGEVIRRWSSEQPEYQAPNPFALLRGEPPEPKLLPGAAGAHRWVWDLRYPDVRLVPEAVLWGSARGPKVVPGRYEVRLTRGESSQTVPLEVRLDPRLDVSEAALAEQRDLALRLRDDLEAAHRGLERLRDVRQQVRDVARRLEEAGHGAGLEEMVATIDERLETIEHRLTQPRNQGIQDALNFPPQLDNQLLFLYGVVTAGEAPPTPAARERFDALHVELRELLAELEEVLEGEVGALAETLAQREVGPIVVP
jgi:photosystem II stability/assembly factor-like uncharacterized protein